MAAAHKEDIAHKLAAAILQSSTEKLPPSSDPFSVSFGTISSKPIYNAHVHRRLANSAALGLGLTGLFLAIGLTAAWYGYFRAIVNPDARSGFGRDPLRRNRGSHVSSNQQGDDFEYDQEEDIDDGTSPPGGGMRRTSDSSGDEGWGQQSQPPPGGLTDPEDPYRGSAMTGESSDIYGDTLGPKGSQRWDWVDRSNEEDDGDDDGEDRNDQYNKTRHNVETFSLPAPRKGKSSGHHLIINDIASNNPKYWRGLSEKVARKQNSEKSHKKQMISIGEDTDDKISSPRAPFVESIDGLLKKHDIGTSIKDGFQQSLRFLRRPAVDNKMADANVPDFKGTGGRDARSTTTTSASSRSGPPMGGHRLQISFDEESLGLYSGSGAGNDIESIEWEAQATERMALARQKSNSGDNGSRGRSTRAPIVIGRVLNS